jgi:hypothetical protein
MGSFDSEEWDEIKPVRSISGERRFSLSRELKEKLAQDENLADLATDYEFPAEKFNTIIAFDVTGSMRPYINYVRQTVEYFATGLVKLLDTKVSFIGVGDHCDGKYMLQYSEPTNSINDIKDNIDSIVNTGGGDTPEAYECLLKELNTKEYDKPTLVFMIGDSVPHNMPGWPAHADNGCPDHVSYKEQLDRLTGKLKAFYFISVGNDSLIKRLHSNLVVSPEYKIDLREAYNMTNVLMTLVMKEVGCEEKWLDLLEIQRGKERREEIQDIVGGGR